MLRERPWYAHANAQRLTSVALLTIAFLAVLDAVTVPNLGLAFLYFIPLFVAAAFMSRWWQVFLLSGICSAFAEGFLSAPEYPDRIMRFIFGFLAYFFVGLMSRKLAHYSRASARRLRDLEEELSERHQSQEQLEMLINSSPAGMVAISPDGAIVFCNQAAHRILGVEPGGLTGRPISTFLPAWDGKRVDQPQEVVACRALRAKGDPFSALVALSSFTTPERSLTVAVLMEAESARPVGQAGAE